MRPVHPSSCQPPQTVYQPISQLHIHPYHSQSVRHPCPPSYEQSVHPPVTLSMTRQSATPPISPVNHLSPSDHLYTILPCLSGCPTLSDHTSTKYTSSSDRPSLPDHLYDLQPSLSDHLPLSHCLYDAPISLSACPSPSDHLTATMTRPPVRLSSHMIHCTQDSSQSLAVVNGEQSHKSKKFHRASTNYNLLLRALDASSIYLHDSRCVARPKSGEDAHITRGRCDFGGTTLTKPSLGFSYMIPKLWDPGGARSPPNVPRDRSRALAPSRYPYAPCTGPLVNLPSLG